MKIMFVGDLNLGEYYLTFGHGPKTKAQEFDIFGNVVSLFAQADIVAGNLEAPLCSTSTKLSSPERQVLRGQPNSAEYLASIGFKILQVANNHIVQHGKPGFDETISVLEKAGIIPIGVMNESLKKIIIDNESFGFMAASDVPDNTNKQQQQYNRLNDAFLEKVKENVKYVDNLFVMLHWGLEKFTEPMEYQYQVMADLREIGVRGIIGSHPHLFYPIVKDKNFIFAPSLGNFVFDLCWDDRLLKSGVLELDVSKNSIHARVWPIEISNDGSVPIIVGDALDIENNIQLWSLGAGMRFQQLKKILYFSRNIMRGNTRMKIKFIVNKLTSKLRWV